MDTLVSHRAVRAKPPPGLQALMTSFWAENIGGYRANIIALQERMRGAGEPRRAVHDLSAGQAAETRNRMLPEQEQLATELKIIAETLAAMQTDLADAAPPERRVSWNSAHRRVNFSLPAAGAHRVRQ